MGIFDGVVKLIGATGNITTSVTARGSKGAVAVEILDASGNQITQFGGDEIGLLDASDVRINPATNEKLDEVIAGLGNITIDTSVLATEATLADIKTSVQLLDNAISGNEMQVDVVTLPDATVVGKAAHGAAVSGNPVLIGGEDPSGNVARFKTAADGDQIVHQHSASTALADAVGNTMHIPVNQTDSGFLGTPTAGYVFNGTTWDRLRGSATDGMTVNLGTNNDVVAAGDVAHDAVDSGNPVKMGFKSASATSLPSATTVGDRTNQAGSTQGEAFVYGTRLHWSEDEINELGKATLKPIAGNTYNLTWEVSAALEASSVVKASAGNAYVAHVYNNNAATRYFQVYNSTTVPADTTVPIISIPIPATSYLRIIFGMESGAPYYFSTGMAWANSTTFATKTVGGSDFWVNFGYM